ncbi:putative clathrin assembly protein At1g25240 [Lolium rigidum]|uniref:putative clathrin assembly protein At1g25240 n=1 Tax=Lolium rigidum TaxID=89674 RepID=UPI001F5DC375|nr:putative clathrin assembly protein At1g25240 [Lolium rigidum]
MTTARRWWRRAAAAVKDRRSLYLTRVVALRPCTGPVTRSAELEAAVIRATSHDERAVDYRGAARVFALARASPPDMQPLMFALARRAGRTQCWAVALKALMLAHGLLLRSDLAPRAARLGRVPFDLADFRDRSAASPNSSGFSAFVRAYFRFLDVRSLFAAQEIDAASDDDDDDDDDARLDRVSKRQHLLELLMQIRPYGDDMEENLVLEAMDCVVIEIFEVYSQVCTGIARFLVSVLGSAPTTPRPRAGETLEAARRRRGVHGMRVLRKAAEQSAQLASYFELCRSLGVLNAAEFPAVERVPEDDIRDLEKLIMAHAQETTKVVEDDKEAKALVAMDNNETASVAVATREWVVFDEGEDIAGAGDRQGYYFDNYVNPFGGESWGSCVPESMNLLA